jgi:hypothetical protein
VARFALAIVCFLAACKSQWTATVHQPPLILNASTEARTSLPAAIVVKDMSLPYLRLANTAYYVVVSRDRLRFHVMINNKWDDAADIRNWGVWLEDQKGEVYAPERVDHAVRASSWGSQPVYRGHASITFYERDIFDHAHRLTLVLKRPGYEYRYVWISGEGLAALAPSSAPRVASTAAGK